MADAPPPDPAAARPDHDDNPYRSPAEPPRLRRKELETTLVIVALIGVILALFWSRAGFGIAALILSAPAIARWLVVIRRRPLRGVDRIVALAGSFGMVVVIAIAAGIACFGACAAGLFAGAFFTNPFDGSPRVGGYFIWLAIGWTSGGVAAVLVGFYMLRATWPRAANGRERPRPNWAKSLVRIVDGPEGQAEQIENGDDID